MKMIDANIILRFILCDNKELANEAAEIIINNECLVTNEIVAEVVYVLSKVYNISRQKISDELTKILNLNSIKPTENDVLRYAIKIYGEKSLDFADCLLVGYNLVYNYEVCTFDVKLNKFLQKLHSSLDNKEDE